LAILHAKVGGLEHEAVGAVEAGFIELHGCVERLGVQSHDMGALKEEKRETEYRYKSQRG
jgi:hypothetical protein